MAVVAAQQFIRSHRAGSIGGVLAAAGCLCLTLAMGVRAAEDPPYIAQESTKVDARTLAGWRAIRQFDCARCHGAQYQGSLGPSLVEAARANKRAQFVRLLLDGNRDRGMPPYREVRGVADNADGIYGYFRGRADGAIGLGTLQLLR